VINVDGTNRHVLHPGGADPIWSPDGEKVAFRSGNDIWTVNSDGTGGTNVTNAAGIDNPFFWSPDAEKIVFSSNRTGSYDVYVINRDGTGLANITNTPGVDERVFGWPGTQKGYPRPRGASPMRLSLVPAYQACASPNATHGAPLAFGSCTPPQAASGRLTTGTPDANGLPVRMEASLTLKALPRNEAMPPDEADLRLVARVNHVLKSDLTDYAGELRAVLPLRITDRNNTPAPGGPGPGTTQPFVYAFDVPCTPTADPNVGSDCAISTTADSLVPGTITEGLRSVWQIGRVRMDDAGADGDTSTAADNGVFAVQGVFVP
jgi:hypothetical protein